MPEITMCLNVECDRRRACYRFCAVPSEQQSYGDFKPERGECSYFACNRPGDVLADVGEAERNARTR